MNDNNKKVSPETQKFLDELKQKTYDTSTIERILAEQRAGIYRHWEPPKSKREQMKDNFKEWIQFAPPYVVFICKVLKFALDILSNGLIIIGFLIALVSAGDVIKAVVDNGWKVLLNKSTLYVAGYVATIYIINNIRFLLYRIIKRV